ncbi:sugar ABC transporter substrate-binding protein [Rhodococcus jostii]|uniref:sugar ABC transporter substrate-binding protein n=1 Tax=Rhodococcus jostii TaxID=132919 RepID=UPI00366184BC
MRNMIRKLMAASVAAAATMAVVSCSSGAGADAAKSIVAFMPSTSNVYLAACAQAAREEAERNGYSLKIIENDFDQAEEDQQVQQFLATGERPAAILWWPSVVDAAINSTRQLAEVAPLIQTDQTLTPELAEHVKAYGGVDQAEIGKISGEMALTARDEAVANGMQLHSPQGNMLEFSFGPGYTAGLDRTAAFKEATKAAPFNSLHNEPTGFDTQAGYEAASQIIPQYKDKGIDFIFTHNNDMAVGVVRALKQNGLTPGKDVIVIGGNLAGDTAPLLAGEVYGAVVQSPVIEGMLAMRSVIQYIETGQVTDDEQYLPPNPELPVFDPKTPPLRVAFQPNVVVNKDNYRTLRLWGMDVPTLVPA